MLGRGDITVTAALSDRVEDRSESVTLHGCLTESTFDGASLVLVRSKDGEVRVLSAKDFAASEKAIFSLAKIGPLGDLKKCQKKYLRPKQIFAHDFIDRGLIEGNPFYEVSGELKSNPTGHLSAFFARKKLEDSYFEASHLSGEFQVNLTVYDLFRATSYEVSCEISTIDYGHNATTLSENTEYRDYFGRKYAVISGKDDYRLNFQVEGDLDGVEVAYCLEEISLDEVALGKDASLPAKDCRQKTPSYWGAKKATDRLSPGFFQLSYRWSKGDWGVGWENILIMVDKICLGDYDASNKQNIDGCTAIGGKVELIGEDVKDLSPFKFVSVINGDLKMEETKMEGLGFLGNLVRAKNIHFFKNHAIEKVEFKRLKRVGKLQIRQNEGLVEFKAPFLERVGGELAFRSNRLLSRVQLDALKEVNGELVMDGNDKLENLYGFGSIEKISKDVTISNNDGLLDLFGEKAQLDSIKGALVVNDNDGLLELSDFSLTTLGKLEVYQNRQLEKISGFDKITELLTLNLSLNPHLTRLTAFNSLLKISGDLIISGNSFEAIFFSPLKEIGGQLYLSDKHLKSLLGLPNLYNMKDRFYILGEASLCEKDWKLCQEGQGALCDLEPALKVYGDDANSAICSSEIPAWFANSPFFNENIVDGCPLNYVKVNANPQVGVTDDFCIMQYEARNVLLTAVSRHDNLPWVNISQGEARGACQRNGENYDLISNSQWQAVARQIEGRRENWIEIDGVYGLKMGHVNDPSKTILEAFKDHSQGSDRALFISSDKVVWDLSGNVWEWTRDINAEHQGQPWFTSSLLEGDPRKRSFGPKGYYANSFGFGWGFFGEGQGAIARGGGPHMTDRAGLFGARTHVDPSKKNKLWGFRCVTSVTDKE